MTTRVEPLDKTVVANGLKLHYLDWGSPESPALVLLHGLRGHAHSWDDVSSALCDRYRVLALDQRGRGDSEWAADGDYSTEAYVADLLSFCTALGLNSFVLAGHSMGGRNAIAFAASHPDNVSKLVIVDIGPTVDPRGAKRIRQELLDVPEEFDSFETIVEYMGRQNRHASDGVLHRRLKYATRELPGGKVGWRYDLVIRDQMRRGTSPPGPDQWPDLPGIACPTLIVRGVETDLLTQEVAGQMVSTFPDGRLVEVESAGHMVFEDNPQGFLEAVKGFL